MRRNVVLLSAAIVIALPAAAQAPLTLADLERMALAASPSLQQSAAEVRASEGRAKQAGLYPNPVIGANGDHVAAGLYPNGGDLGASIQQRIVTAGKLGLARKAAEQSRAAAAQMQEAERLRVLINIRTLYYRAMGEQRLVALRKEALDLAARTARTARDLANLGQADRPDVLASDVEAQRAELGVTMAQNALDRTWREIGAMVAQPSLAAQEFQGDFEAIPKIDASAIERIYAASPELRAAEADRAGADLLAERARVEKIPDIQLSGGVRYNRGLVAPGQVFGTEGFFDVGVEIPVFNRNQGALSAARAEAEKARLESDRQKLALARRFAAVYREYRDAADAAVRYRDSMIPSARQAYEMYASNFGNMAAPYTQVLLTQRSLFQLEEEYLSVLMSAWRSAIEIDGLLVTGSEGGL